MDDAATACGPDTQAGELATPRPWQSIYWRPITAGSEDHCVPPAEKTQARDGAGPRRLSISVEVVAVHGMEADRLAEVQLEAIKEVLEWHTGQHRQRKPYNEPGDRAA